MLAGGLSLSSGRAGVFVASVLVGTGGNFEMRASFSSHCLKCGSCCLGVMVLHGVDNRMSSGGGVRLRVRNSQQHLHTSFASLSSIAALSQHHSCISSLASRPSALEAQAPNDICGNRYCLQTSTTRERRYYSVGYLALYDETCGTNFDRLRMR